MWFWELGKDKGRLELCVSIEIVYVKLIKDEGKKSVLTLIFTWFSSKWWYHFTMWAGSAWSRKESHEYSGLDKKIGIDISTLH